MVVTRVRRIHSSLLSSALVLLGGLVAAGCAQVVPYQPRTTLVQEIGLEPTKKQLFDLFGQNRIRRALPPVVDTGFMSQFTRVQIYNNGLFDYIGVNGRSVRFLRLKLPSSLHAQQYADALMSLHAYVFGQVDGNASPQPTATQPAQPADPNWPQADQPPPSAGPTATQPGANVVGECATCGYTLIAGDEYCQGCGRSTPALNATPRDTTPAPAPAQATPCGTCGADLVPGDAYCANCGSKQN